MATPDPRNRPVILETRSAPALARRRYPRPRTLLALTSAIVVAAAGIAAGSWSVWSAVVTTEPTGNPAPIWFSPPAPELTSTTDDPPTARTSPASTSRRGGDDEPSTEDRSGPGHRRGRS